MKFKITGWLDFALQGFGFSSFEEFKVSTFGFIMSSKVVYSCIGIGLIESFFQKYIGMPLIVFGAFVLLNFLEYRTGIKVAKKKGERIESRKMGRMFLKVGVYIAILFILQSFKNNLEFPKISDFELDPFNAMYWGFLTGVIYQLFKSLLENLEALGYKEANGVLGWLTRRFGNKYQPTEHE